MKGEGANLSWEIGVFVPLIKKRRARMCQSEDADNLSGKTNMGRRALVGTRENKTIDENSQVANNLGQGSANKANLKLRVNGVQDGLDLPGKKMTSQG